MSPRAEKIIKCYWFESLFYDIFGCLLIIAVLGVLVQNLLSIRGSLSDNQKFGFTPSISSSQQNGSLSGGTLTILPTDGRVRRIVKAVAKPVVSVIESVASLLFRRPVELRGQDRERTLFQNTVLFLKSLFGDQRVKRVIKYMKIDQYELIGRTFTKGDMKTFLCCLELVTKDDMQELLDELRSNKNVVRTISAQDLSVLRKQFENTSTVEMCSTAQLQSLEQFLLPFTSSQEEFWNNLDEIQHRLPSPVSFPQLVESVAWVRHALRTKNVSEEDWDVAFAKRFAAIKLPPHTVVSHPQGYLYLSHAVEGRALKLFFQPLGTSSAQRVVLYGSTTDSITKSGFAGAVSSYKEDVQPDMGARGIIETYEETKQLFQNPQRGFVKTKQDTVRCIGHSLGAVHAMRDAVLFFRQVTHLTGVCSPGVDAKTADVYRKVICANDLSPSLRYVMEEGDVIPLAGERLLGDGCQPAPTVKMLRPSNTVSQPFLRFNLCARNIWHFPSNMLQVSRAHSRLLVLEPHQEKRLEGKEKQNVLCHAPETIDPRWERARKRIGSIFVKVGAQFATFAEKQLGLSVVQ